MSDPGRSPCLDNCSLVAATILTGVFEHAFEARLTEATGSSFPATSGILVTAVMPPRGRCLPGRNHDAPGGSPSMNDRDRLHHTDHPSRAADGYGSDQVAGLVRTGLHYHPASPPGMFDNPQEGLGTCLASARCADGAGHRADGPAGQSSGITTTSSGRPEPPAQCPRMRRLPASSLACIGLATSAIVSLSGADVSAGSATAVSGRDPPRPTCRKSARLPAVSEGPEAGLVACRLSLPRRSAGAESRRTSSKRRREDTGSFRK